MSLCFCENCSSTARSRGIDFPRIRSWVRVTLDRHFADPFSAPVEMGWDELKASLDGEFQRFLDMRCDVLTSLLREIVESVRGVSDCRIAVLDFGPLFGLGPDGRRWQSGVDISDYLALVDEIHPTFYFTDLNVLRTKMDEYTAVLNDEKPMYAAIRGILPQVKSAKQLREQLEPIAPHAAGFSFYNYGFMALPVLDWIREGMNSVSRGEN